MQRPLQCKLSIYLRSTFGFRGQDAASKGTTAETLTLCTILENQQTTIK
jgi:hypothetical protein